MKIFTKLNMSQHILYGTYSNILAIRRKRKTSHNKSKSTQLDVRGFGWNSSAADRRRLISPKTVEIETVTSLSKSCISVALSKFFLVQVLPVWWFLEISSDLTASLNASVSWDLLFLLHLPASRNVSISRCDLPALRNLSVSCDREVDCFLVALLLCRVTWTW